MFLRLLIMAILGAVIYRAVKSWLNTIGQPRRSRTVQPPGQVDDVMIQDPVCGIYFPRRNAVALTLDNRSLHFCSIECRDRYVAQQSQHQSR